jgi:O-acetyl-ADP-ribose deacetylase (regulator of RNase III)
MKTYLDIITGYPNLGVSSNFISTVAVDIFEAFEATENVVLVHCSNCWHTMGSGIARIVREKYPLAFEADQATKIGAAKLGSCSMAKVNEEFHRTIVNLYGQNLFTRESLGDRDVSYDAIYDGFRELFRLTAGAQDVDKILIPWQMASDLAGGKWEIVSSIINTLKGEYNIEVVICRLPSTLK